MKRNWNLTYHLYPFPFRHRQMSCEKENVSMWNFVMKIAAVQSTAAAFLIHLFLIRFLICAFYSASFIFSHFLIQFDVPSMICMYTQYSKTLNRK